MDRDTQQSSLPSGWDDRERVRVAEASQRRAFPPLARGTTQSGVGVATDCSTDARVALLQVTTHSLNALATSLEIHPTMIPPSERQAFAVALKRAMDAMTKNQ